MNPVLLTRLQRTMWFESRCPISLQRIISSRCAATLNPALLISLMLTLSACATAQRRETRAPGQDLVERFQIVPGLDVAAAGANPFARHLQVTRNGARRDAMLLVAPVTIRASLSGVAGHVLLEGLFTPVYNVGDGIMLEVLILDAHREQRIYSRYFDPGRSERDRHWIPISIPVDLNGAPDAQLEIRISAGPQGDLVADWLAISALNLVPQGARR